jgi:hypothetical protein
MFRRKALLDSPSMRGVVSFHPVDLAFFDEMTASLAAGRKVNPEAFLQTAARVRRNGWVARRFAVALRDIAASAEAPKADPASNLWHRLRTNLERMDFRPDEVARLAAKHLEPDLHLDGRPFFVAEGSAERVADAVALYAGAESEDAAEKIARDQLARMDPVLAAGLEPAEIPDLGSDLTYRNDLLGSLKQIHDLARSAREDRTWADGDASPRPAREVLPNELPWRAVAMHAKSVPFWVALDVDGLETICRAAGVLAPDCLSPAWRLFAEACEAYPEMRTSLKLEMSKARDVGAFVAPGEVGRLVEFLTLHGARIIGAATRAGEGPMATALLRKIKECAVYAQKRGFGYLEASGILPPERED